MHRNDEQKFSGNRMSHHLQDNDIFFAIIRNLLRLTNLKKSKIHTKNVHKFMAKLADEIGRKISKKQVEQR